eukprot:Skav206714  [mRNA]  locus=scaffold3267:57298:66135:+ [translate_table: standard]
MVHSWVSLGLSKRRFLLQRLARAQPGSCRSFDLASCRSRCSMAKVGVEDLKRPKEGLQQRRAHFRSNTAALCLHCEDAHHEENFVNFFDMPDPDPDSLRHMIQFKSMHGGLCSCAMPTGDSPVGSKAAMA